MGYLKTSFPDNEGLPFNFVVEEFINRLAHTSRKFRIFNILLKLEEKSITFWEIFFCYDLKFNTRVIIQLLKYSHDFRIIIDISNKKLLNIRRKIWKL